MQQLRKEYKHLATGLDFADNLSSANKEGPQNQTQDLGSAKASISLTMLAI